MSGGVDSSVAAWLLKKQGYDVIGVTMQIWQDEEETAQQENGGCCGLSAVDDARRVAWQLEIPYYVMNFKKEFRDNVMDYFVGEYLCGRTPNPCIACNRYVKWESLLKRSLDIGADYIATGHYARVEQLPNGCYCGKGSDLRAVQSDPGAAFPYAYAGGGVYQGPDPSDRGGYRPAGGPQGRQSGNLLHSGQ